MEIVLIVAVGPGNTRSDPKLMITDSCMLTVHSYISLKLYLTEVISH